MAFTPYYQLLVNGRDIDAGTPYRRLIGLRLTDEVGFQSDLLEFTLSDADDANPLALPRTGAEIELVLGYRSENVAMGKFVVDEVEREGWPHTLTIRARSAAFENSDQGLEPLQTQHNRVWEEIEFWAVVDTIAKEHGLEGQVSASLGGIIMTAQYQIDESDLHFLTRLARKYDALVKVGGGKLLVIKRAEAKAASGNPLPEITLQPTEVSAYRMTRAHRDVSGTVRAYYHDVGAAKRHAVTVGRGDPETSLKTPFADQASAMAAAKAELDRRTRQRATINLQLPGRPSLCAEQLMILKGFPDGVNGEWSITRVEHELGDSGYSCSVQAEIVREEKSRPTGLVSVGEVIPIDEPPPANDTMEGANDPDDG